MMLMKRMKLILQRKTHQKQTICYYELFDNNKIPEGLALVVQQLWTPTGGAITVCLWSYQTLTLLAG